MTVQQLGQNAKGCAAQINTASTADKNRALSVIAEELEAGVKQIIEENKKDIATARESLRQ